MQSLKLEHGHCFSDVEPSGVISANAEEGDEEKEGCLNRGQRRCLDMVIVLSGPPSFVDEELRGWS